MTTPTGQAKTPAAEKARDQFNYWLREAIRAGVCGFGAWLGWSAWQMTQGKGLGAGCDAASPDTCAAITLPMFSGHLGVPIPLLGLAGYGALAAVTLLLWLWPKLALAPKLPLVAARRVLALGAFACSVYLTMFQAVFIGHFCPLCLSSAIGAAVLFGLEFFDDAVRLPAPWPSRATLAKLAVTAAIVLVPGTLGLRQIWDPLADLEARKAAFLAGVPGISLKQPKNAAPGEPVLVVLIDKPGCVFCASFFGDTMQDENLRQALKNFRVVKADVTADNAVLAQWGVSQAPAVLMVGHEREQSRFLKGVHPAEVVVAFLAQKMQRQDVK